MELQASHILSAHLQQWARYKILIKQYSLKILLYIIFLNIFLTGQLYAFESGQTWNRVLNEKNVDNKFLVFFVDTGRFQVVQQSRPINSCSSDFGGL